MRDYFELTKPRITQLVVVTTGIGYFFGLPAGSFEWLSWRSWLPFLITLAGTALVASGTFALNQWYEREADFKMRRTADRPLPGGRLTANSALVFGAVVALCGFVLLTLAVNLLTGLLSLFTFVTYLLVYTPLKQRSSLATVVGALPGAMPPLIGYAASNGKLTPDAWALFAILFIWQFPHFLAIAWMYREDYSRAGIMMLPVVDPDGRSTSRQIVIYASTLIPVSLFPTLLGMTGRIYLVGALVLGLWFLYAGVRVAFDRTALRARRVLLVSVIYLPLIYGLMLFDRPA